MVDNMSTYLVQAAHTHPFTALWTLSKWVSQYQNQSGIYWSKRQWMAVTAAVTSVGASSNSETRRRSESAYIRQRRQVNFLQLLCMVGEGDCAPLKLNLYLKTRFRNNRP